MKETDQTRVLVLGAYGLIGAGVCRHLLSLGYAVTGLGRDEATAKRVLPHISWLIRDLRSLQDADDWQPLIERFGTVINCAGTLQSGGHDNTGEVQHHSIAALAQACETSGTKIIQISAIGARDDASTAFMRTKAAGDKAVRETQTDSWILRPGLVLANHAYGGTALIRMLAAVPFVQPLALAGSPIQTVALDDICQAIDMCLRGDIPPGTQADLVERDTHTLADIITAHRSWLGLNAARAQWSAPGWLVHLTSKGADLLGQLGWRSALRSTAVLTLQSGVTGNGDEWPTAGGHKVMDLQATLRSMPATAEHRLAARLALLFPFTIATLFLFWLASGLVGLVQLDRAASVLVTQGWSPALAKASVVGWSLVDIALATGLLVRRFATRACLLMVAVSLFYLLATTLFVPQLWLDPLGPMIKVFPAILLAFVARILLESR